MMAEEDGEESGAFISGGVVIASSCLIDQLPEERFEEVTE